MAKTNNIETELALTCKDVMYMKTEISEIKTKLDQVQEQLTNIANWFENKFAFKRVERVAKWLIGIVLTWFASALLMLVLK